MEETVIIHPNRETADAKTTRATVMFLLLLSAGLILAIMAGGWDYLQGAQVISFSCAVTYVVLAIMVGRWKRGVLPVAAALAILFAIVAAVAAPPWFDRDKAGFNDPTLDPSFLGMLTLIIVVVQVLLLVFAIRGFRQLWNVEVAVPRDQVDAYRRGEGGELQTA